MVECAVCCGPTQEGLLDVKLGRGERRLGLSTKTGACRLELLDAVVAAGTMMSVALLEEWCSRIGL